MLLRELKLRGFEPKKNLKLGCYQKQPYITKTEQFITVKLNKPPALKVQRTKVLRQPSLLPLSKQENLCSPQA